MLARTAKLEIQAPSRHEAEARLRDGTAPKTLVTTTDLGALTVLHNMATAPNSASASAALKLLHELQVHQVELDLQHEQLKQSQDELTYARDQYVERFDFAPVAYCIVGRDGTIIEGNLAAAELFALEQTALSGRRIDDLLSSHSRFVCLEMLKRLRGGAARESCEVQVDGSDSVMRQLRIVATISPREPSFMMALIERQ